MIRKCYNDEAIVSKLKINSYTNYWDNIIKNSINEIPDANLCSYYYIDDKYILNPFKNNNCEKEKGSVLLSVNGMSPDKYISSGIFQTSLHYDGKNKKAYREALIFNDKYGEPVNVEVKFPDGSVISKKLYSDIYSELYYLIDKPQDNNKQVNYLSTENYSYLKIDHFFNTEEEVKKAFDLMDTDTIIIDLRDNSGGDPYFAQKFIYPNLYNRNIKARELWYVKDTKENKRIFDNFFTHTYLNLNSIKGEKLYFSDEKDYLYSDINTIYLGRQSDNKEVILLTSCDTGSAADTLTAVLKDNRLATVIGNNTGGEGLMGSYLMNCCPNSMLIFSYMPGKAFNADGTDNSAYGTAPDIYVNQSYESY